MMDNESFFRLCWLTLKAISSARLRKQMDEIECKVMGIRVTQQPPAKPSPKKSEGKKNEPTPEPIVPI